MIKTFLITIQTTGYVTYRVKAGDAEEACAIVNDGIGLTTEEESYGDHGSDPDEWEIEEEAD